MDLCFGTWQAVGMPRLPRVDEAGGLYHGLFASPATVATNYYFNKRGQGEKYFQGNNYGPNRGWYFILSDGRFFIWRGSIETSELLATLDASYHANPQKLWDAHG